MRRDEQSRQWVHTEECEADGGFERVRREDMPPSLRRLIDSYENELTRIRGRGAIAIQLLEEARRAHLHDALGEKILAWMQCR